MTLNEEPSNQPDIDAHDTPTQRATINQLSVDELDFMLQSIRQRRLERVKKLEAIAKVRSDETRLENFLRYEKLVATARKSLAKLEEMEEKAEAAIHKVRVVVMMINMEVSADD